MSKILIRKSERNSKKWVADITDADWIVGFVQPDGSAGGYCDYEREVNAQDAVDLYYFKKGQKTSQLQQIRQFETGATKDTNPKDAVGVKKWRQFCTIPKPPLWAIGLAMLEGARKYGRHNYRKASVRASVYLDAVQGHLQQFEEGENIDIDSGFHHLAKAAASIIVLFDGILNDNWVDDRPMKCNLNKIRNDLQKQVSKLFEKYPDAVKPYLEIDNGESGGEK